MDDEHRAEAASDSNQHPASCIHHDVTSMISMQPMQVDTGRHRTRVIGTMPGTRGRDVHGNGKDRDPRNPVRFPRDGNRMGMGIRCNVKEN